MTSITLTNVIKNGGKNELPLLEDVSLSVPAGSSLVLVGPHNAGKSLLMRLIAGLEPIDDGEIHFDDSLVNAASPRDRDVSMVFQDFELFPHLDVFDNLAFSARLRKGTDKADLEERVLDVADFLGLESYLSRKPRELTTPQRQIVALGRSLVRDALLYLFDDAFSSLDVRTRSHVKTMTAQWQREHDRTSIYATNEATEALTLGDQIAVVHHGYVHQVGSAEDLYRDPRDLFVAGYLGEPPMNLIPATVHQDTLETPFMSVPLTEEVRERAQQHETLLIGIRPEDCQDAASLTDRQLAKTLQFSTKIEEVEWRGNQQYIYLGFDIDEETSVLLEEIEQHLDFDLFQTYVLATFPTKTRYTRDMFARVAVDSSKICVFDPVTGENLTHIPTD